MQTKDTKFCRGQWVRVVGGFNKGAIGRCTDYFSTINEYWIAGPDYSWSGAVPEHFLEATDPPPAPPRQWWEFWK